MMSETPTCGLCPAFLFDPESVALHRCFGCRQPPAQQRVTEPPPRGGDPLSDAEGRRFELATRLAFQTCARLASEWRSNQLGNSVRRWEEQGVKLFGAELLKRAQS
jgi:hypothetical protein